MLKLAKEAYVEAMIKQWKDDAWHYLHRMAMFGANEARVDLPDTVSVSTMTRYIERAGFGWHFLGKRDVVMSWRDETPSQLPLHDDWVSACVKLRECTAKCVPPTLRIHAAERVAMARLEEVIVNRAAKGRRGVRILQRHRDVTWDRFKALAEAEGLTCRRRSSLDDMPFVASVSGWT